MDRVDLRDLRRALLDLRVAIDDADGVARDMLRPPRDRELGPRIHARNYRDAHRKVEELITYLLHHTDSPPPTGEAAPH